MERYSREDLGYQFGVAGGEGCGEGGVGEGGGEESEKGKQQPFTALTCH